MSQTSSLEVRGLSVRERAFAQAYARSGNARNAAISAGYRESAAGVAARRLLRRDSVLAQIAKFRESAADPDAATAENLIERYRIAAMQKPLDFLIEQPDGSMRLKRPSELTPEQREAVSDVKIRTVVDKATGTSRQVFEFRFESRRDARRSLTRILGLNQDRLDINHNVSGRVTALFQFVASNPSTSETRARLRARFNSASK